MNPNDSAQIPEGFPNERLLILPGKLLEALSVHRLAHRLHPTRIGFFPEARGHYIERREPINEAVFLLCLKGAGRIECAGQTAGLAAPAYLWLPAGQPHHYTADASAPWTLAWLHLAGTEAGTHMQLCGAPATSHPIQHSELARDRFERLYSLSTSARTSLSGQFRLHTELANWLAGLAQSHEAHAATVDARSERLDRLLRHLRGNLHRTVSLTEMAAITAWTPNHLNTIFRERLKDSPASYFLHLKMARACEQLRDKEQSITGIAESLGFEDSFYFSRCFKRCYGLSPSEYRKSR